MQLLSRVRLSAPVAVASVMLVTLVVLVSRSAGIYPGIMGDEYLFSTMSRLTPLSIVTIPNYLYFSIYKFTSACGDGYLECSRVLNAVFFVASAPFIYFVARKFCGSRVSLLIVVLSMMGPINSYTVYFMPDTLFFLSFWVCVSYFLSLSSFAFAKHWLFFGFLMGLSSLVKPHALFMIPAFCLCILIFSYSDRVKNWLVVGLKNSALFLAAMLMVKFSLGYLLAGKAGLTILGGFYTSTFEAGGSTLQRYLDIASQAPMVAGGHLLANSLMFGVALAVVIVGSVEVLSRREISVGGKVSFCTLAILLNLIAVVALFTASVAGSNSAESIFRLHMRYYNFMLPLLFIAAAAQLSRAHDSSLRYLRLATALVIVSAIAYAAVTHMAPYILSHVDGPELHGYARGTKSFVALAVLSGFAVLLWYKAPRAGVAFFTFAYLPLSVAVMAVFNNAEVRQRMVVDAYDKAGMFAKSYVPDFELSKLIVLGDSMPAKFRTLFYIDNLGSTIDSSYVYAAGKPYSVANLPDDKKWVLAVGDVEFEKSEFEVLNLNGFSLAKRATGAYSVLDFRKGALWDPSVKTSGLSSAEAWGTWSDSGKVSITFEKPLPEVFDLVLTASAFGPNVDQDFYVELNAQRTPFTLTATSAPHVVRVRYSGSSNVLSIIVPSPSTPKQLGISGDDRPLGLGIEQVEIRKAN